MAKLSSGKTFVVFTISIAIIFLQILLNKILYRFHAKRDNKALGNCESFPVNGHYLHTNRESFPTQKFCRIRYFILAI